MIKMQKDQKLKLMTLKREDNPFNLAIKHKQRSTSERTTSDSNKTIQGSHSSRKRKSKSTRCKMVYSLVQQSLSVKYNTTPRNYLIIELENVIQSKYCRTLAVFKEKLLFNYQDEFLKRYYKRRESKDRIPKFVAYYKNYLSFFCNSIFAELSLNDLIQAYSERKAKIFYAQNCKENSNDNKGQKEHYLKDKDQEKQKKDNNTIFNTTIKDNISMNSFSTFMLNTLDSNEFNAKTLVQNPSNFINQSSVEAVNELMYQLSPHSKLKKTVTDINTNTNTTACVSYPIKKLLLKKKQIKKNQFLIIDKAGVSKSRSIREKKTSIINNNIAESPKVKVLGDKGINQFIGYNKGSKKDDYHNSTLYHTSRNKGQDNHLSKKTESFNKINQNSTLISKFKLFNKNSFTKTFNHNKNVYSTQITEAITERIRQTVVKISSKTLKEQKENDKGFLRQAIPVDKENKKHLVLNSLPRTSRNTKCQLDKCFYTIENNTYASKSKKKGKEGKVDLKLPLFKTLTFKGDYKHTKIVSLSKYGKSTSSKL